MMIKMAAKGVRKVPVSSSSSMKKHFSSQKKETSGKSFCGSSSKRLNTTSQKKDTTGQSSASSSNLKKYVFFYTKESPFSQHHECSFSIEGVRYNCAEQYMMHQKAVVFGDHKSAEEIMKAKSPGKQKQFGRKVKPFDPVKWESVCVQVVKKANVAKFSQNPGLKKKLLETGGKTLVEASRRDFKWGIGLSEKVAATTDPSEWRGKNLLGKILTEVREELIALNTAELLDEWSDAEDPTEK